ncbi:chorismate mutase [Hathewaya histolytica]|uniref:Bifunctional chorismate mutase/prephenate dehydratase n=1 Tax=Hathewaya histolytica TaxID=1498 RepID=A0A4U9R6W8_HATHI|nr:chorismate mutase [Hathewaya histolytica]VTQ84440.1 bifunctional chorismate mutase/prephenate dehydratase [Hathewaya histolytica]
MEDIKNIRREIDNIDKELVRIFEERLNLSLKVMEYKKERSLPILDKNREEQVIKQAKENLNNIKYEEYLEDFFTKLMEISKKVQYHVGYKE